ncbi:MAG: ATP-dependent zinc protease [Candidatus Marinimicrobia bacterium]|nr:ATP-dependent zinc protease [Candidatus Neomarinimicrobiota bacterium]
MKNKSLKIEKPVIGWREWVCLPDMGIISIKVKVDTGARSSSLHVFELKQFQKDGESWVRFKVHPVQKKATPTLECEAKLLEYRSIRSSSGKASIRPVILTNLMILGETYPVELTLASRDEMGFRMLLGREAFRGRFLVDAGRSYYGGKPLRKQKNKAS